jgi:hypothetical protein
VWFNHSRVQTRLTTVELAKVVSALEQPCSARRVRYALSAGGTNRQGRGRTRLHAADDVALMRVALRLEAAGVSAWVARVVLAYLQDSLIAAIRSRRPKALHVFGVRGSIRPASEPAPPGTIVVPLRSVMHGVLEKMRQTRRDTPTIWAWQQLSPAAAWRVSNDRNRDDRKVPG